MKPQIKRAVAIAAVAVGLLAVPASSSASYEFTATQAARMAVITTPSLCPSIRQAMRWAGYWPAERVFVRSFGHLAGFPPAPQIFHAVVRICRR